MMIPNKPHYRLGATIDDAFRLRTPEAFGHGVLDDRVARLWWTHLRRTISPTLDGRYGAIRYTPIWLLQKRVAFLRDALLASHLDWAPLVERTIVEGLPDEQARQHDYIARPWPRFDISNDVPHDGYDPLSEVRVANAKRCWRCFGDKLKPVARGELAYAWLLIALGLPVPDAMAGELADRVAEEIACLPLAEESSGYGNWTIRSGALRVFGAYLDPHQVHPSTTAFAHSVRANEARDMADEHLWRLDTGRDLDGFLLTPIGWPTPTLHFSARASPDGPIGHDEPSLVVRVRPEGRHAPRSPATDPILVSILHPGVHLWGSRLDPEAMALTTAFVTRHQEALVQHYRGDIDSVDLLKALKGL